MKAYYNENDPKAAAWLRELILRGYIAPGEVDERSIVDVRPSDLGGYNQAHFFAGIGGWSYALRLAGWPDDRPVWTGSCPCQPFSVAGKRAGTADKRHLWPEFKRLIAHREPAVVFGEQVASKDGRGWLAGVRLDLEAMGYGVGAADLCAASAGAPHIRQRLYWMADSGSEQHQGTAERSEPGRWNMFRDGGAIGGMDNTADSRYDDPRQHDGGPSLLAARSIESSAASRMADPPGSATRFGGIERGEESTRGAYRTDDDGRAWSDFDVLACTDGKSRRVESGTFPLAHGIPARMGRLRGYGNAIVPQVAAEFIKAAI